MASGSTMPCCGCALRDIRRGPGFRSGAQPYARPMATTVDLLHAGYARDDGVGSTVVLVRDGDARIVVDPGMADVV